MMIEQRNHKDLSAFLRNERGSALAAVLILTTVILLSGMAFLSLYTAGRSVGRRDVNRARAFYLAEGGIQQAVWRMRHTNRNHSTIWRALLSIAGSAAINMSGDHPASRPCEGKRASNGR